MRRSNFFPVSWRQHSSTIERTRSGRIVALKMRKLSTVESLRHRSYVGTAAPGCPAERSSAVLKSSRKSEAACLADSFKLSFDSRLGNHGEGKNRRVSLARTAEGGCPHMSIAEDSV